MGCLESTKSKSRSGKKQWERHAMNLEEAEEAARYCLSKLTPVSERIEVVGSIRRRRPQVRDVDILLIPGKDLISFRETLAELFGLLTADGEKIKRGTVTAYEFALEVQVDLYIADEKNFECLKLVRTGSASHNLRLASLAKSKKMKLHASGLGLTNEKNEIVASDERGIFDALGVPYLKPEDRDPESYLGLHNTLSNVAPPRHD